MNEDTAIAVTVMVVVALIAAVCIAIAISASAMSARMAESHDRMLTERATLCAQSNDVVGCINAHWEPR